MDIKFFKLQNKTLVMIDWANVYGWFKSLKWEIDPQKLYDYLTSYEEIKKVAFYYGKEIGNIKSEEFQKKIKNIGYDLKSKEVKFVPIFLNQQLYLKETFKNIFNLIDNLIKDEDCKAITKLNVFKKKLQEEFKKPILRRKCDFDTEFARDIYNNINDFETLIIFSGDGDYAPLVDDLIKKNKKVIVVFARGHRGKEYGLLKKKPFLCRIDRIKQYIIKNIPKE